MCGLKLRVEELMDQCQTASKKRKAVKKKLLDNIVSSGSPQEHLEMSLDSIAAVCIASLFVSYTGRGEGGA
jgi:hypothetical protein